MMTRIWTMILVGVGSLALVAAEPKQRVAVSDTQHLDFPAGGQLRLKNSTGELRIDAWDQPSFEITTIKSTKEEYAAAEREKATHELERVRIKAERSGDEIVVTTEFPRHRFFPPPTPWGSAVDFDLEYDIKVPRNARLVVDHNTGEVHVDGVTGEIRVHNKQGLIALHLPEDGKYDIDAKSDYGTVNSDFPGSEKHAFFLGHRFTGNASGAAQKLRLRIRYGDIVLLRVRIPAAPPPVR